MKSTYLIHITRCFEYFIKCTYLQSICPKIMHFPALLKPYNILQYILITNFHVKGTNTNLQFANSDASESFLKQTKIPRKNPGRFGLWKQPGSTDIFGGGIFCIFVDSKVRIKTVAAGDFGASKTKVYHGRRWRISNRKFLCHGIFPVEPWQNEGKHLNWATFKALMAFHHADWFIGILMQ